MSDSLLSFAACLGFAFFGLGVFSRHREPLDWLQCAVLAVIFGIGEYVLLAHP